MMKTKKITLNISDAIGKVSAEYLIPDHPECIITIAHGAGADMNHAFMQSLSKALAAVNIATLRFNFPFMEHKKGRPDSPAVAHATIKTALKHAGKTFPGLPLFASGKSFGGRMSSQLLATDPDTTIKGLIFYGFPLHPAGKPSTERSAHLKEITIPMLFLQGTRDTLATWQLINEVSASLPDATLVEIENADHSFKAGKRDTMQELVTATQKWIDDLLNR